MTAETENLTKSFLADLRQKTGLPLKIRLNNNRSTMLNVQWKQGYTSASIHRLFVGAPGSIIDLLAGYLRGDQKKLAPAVKAYIEQQIAELDYSSRIDQDCLHPIGTVYDLREIFNEINKIYFNGQLSLFITWYGKLKQQFGRSITFGMYDETMKLVRVHRILDHYKIPRFVVGFVVYHEMLHHVCRPYVDKKGVNRIHHSDFRLREKKYADYIEATEWMSCNKEALFTGEFWKDSDHGWT